MEKINIAELLKDCPKGTELYSPLFGNCKFVKIHDYEAQIIVELETGTTVSFQTDGRYYDYPNAECILFPKSKTTWEGFQVPFKNGDIIYTKTYISEWISIFEKFDDDECKCYIDYSVDSDTYYGEVGGKKNTLCEINDIIEQRLATEEEKAKLFQAIKDNGYKWNEETKTLEKLIEPKFKVGDRIKHRLTGEVYIVLFVLSNGYGGGVYDVAVTNEIGKSIDVKEQDNYELVPNKFDITTLKTFDKVLVRQSVHGIWGIDFFGFYNYDEGYYYTTSNCAYTQCIPYEQNKHLLGTTDDCDEYFKIW